MEKFWNNKLIRAALLYLAAIAVFYGPVMFLGKTLQPALYQPHGVLDGWAYGYEGRVPESTFNIDLATPAYYETPINKLAGNLYKNGELPLWNPYQGAGMPLSAQYSTRVFFPYQIFEDISPVRLWDYFILGRLFIAGFFTFLFLNSLGLEFAPAFLGGLFYMFSGSFTWFINLEQFTNNAMALPVHMYFLERLVKSRMGRDIALCGLSFGLMLLAGQPEIALYALFLGACYYLVRTLHIQKGRALLRVSSRYLIVTVIGFSLAAPLILPFLEFMKNSHHLHQSKGDISTRDNLRWIEAMGIFTPAVTELPQMHRRAVRGRTPGGEPFYFRIFPENGAWDRLGGYTGIIPILLSSIGVILAFSKRHRRWRPYAVFFVSFALFIIFKNIGLRPFIWLSSLPLFNLVWSQRWAGPVWVFSTAASAAIGFQMIRTEPEGGYLSSRKAFGILTALSLVLLVYLYMDYSNFVQFRKIWSSGLETVSESISRLFLKEFIGPSFMLSSILTVLFLFAGAIAIFNHTISKKGIYAIAALAFLELWWAAPRGYGSGWLFYKLIPLSIGLLGVIALALNRFRFSVVCAVAFFCSFAALDLKSEKGFPERHDPFEAAPYVRFIKNLDGFDRVVAGEGILFPNFASAMGIQDIRFINSLSLDSLHEYKTRYLQDEENLYFSLWFTGRKTRYSPVGEILDEKIEESVLKHLKHYSFLGVRYIILPKSSHLDLPTVYEDGDVVIYENTQALPRAFLVNNIVYATCFKAAQEKAAADGFDMRRASVIEEQAPDGFGSSKEAISKNDVRITSYKANSVDIDVDTPEDAMLVLTDTYYPGWRAYIDGAEANVYRVNGLVRGVFVTKGAHKIEFKYRPRTFIIGMAYFLTGIAIISIIDFYGRKQKEKHDL